MSDRNVANTLWDSGTMGLRGAAWMQGLAEAALRTLSEILESCFFWELNG